MTDNVNDELIIERALIAFECKNQGQLADLFNVSSQDLSNRKRKGTLQKLLKKEAFRRGINYDWIKTGTGNMMTESGTRTVAESPAPYIRAGTETEHTGIGTLLDQTIEVLKSNTKYGKALKENIEAFHMAVTNDKPKLDSDPSKKEDDPSSTAGGSNQTARKKAVL